MLNSFLGRKMGMTQIFDKEGKVIPVTVINVANWFITQIKTSDKDGYISLQLGLLKKKYQEKSFSLDWLSEKNKYFVFLREVALADASLEKLKIGQNISFDQLALEDGDLVNVAGASKGKGFQGVVKRWGFAGGPKSHGSNFHRKPGSIGNMCSQGNVVKGKKLPGHCGCKRVTIKNLRVAQVSKDTGCLLVRGAVPGKKNSLLFVSKQG